MRRIHYAWVILLLCFVAITAGVGVRLAFGTFVHPWEQEFGVGRSATGLIATISFFTFGLAQPVLGRWADRGGPHRALAASLAIVAVAMVLAAFSPSIWMVGVAFALVASPGFAGLSQVTGSVAISNWFHDRRGLAMSILTLASAVGQMTIGPASLFLNDTLGWRQTLLIYTGVVAVLAPLVLWLLRPNPAAMNLLPYGATEAEVLPRAEAKKGAGTATLRQVLTLPNFWWLAVPYFVCGVTTTGLIDTHLVPFAHDHHLPQSATALAVVLLAGFNSLGVMLSGYLSDRLPRRYLLAFLYAVRALTLLFLITVRDGQALLIFSVVYGLVDFSTVPPTISLSSDLLGSENVGLVYGLISLTHQLGSATGAFVPGLLFDRTGSYHSSLLMASAALLVATTFSFWIRERRGVPVRAAAG